MRALGEAKTAKSSGRVEPGPHRTIAVLLRRALHIALPVIVLCAAAVGAPGSPAAQERKVIRMEGGGPIFILRELMVALVEKDGKVFVKVELPGKPGAKADAKTNLAENDVVVRVNGKKIASIADRKKLYEEAKPGDTMKIGVKRGEERFIASFAKADPKNAPEGMIIKTIEIPADSAAGEKKE